jgi:hypothetical protein
VILKFELRSSHLQRGHQWLTPVILANQEAEIRRIVVQSQPRQISGRPYLKKTHHKKKGWWSGSRCRPRVQTPVLEKKMIFRLKCRRKSITSQSV